MYNQGIRQYQKTNIESTTPERLIVMLYEGAIRNLQNARTALREHDRSGQALGIRKAHAIISELRHSLNHEIEPEIADNLDGLYGYILGEISRTGLDNDVTHLENALRTIAPLYDAWRRIPSGSSQRSAAGPLPATGYGTSRPAGQESEAVESHELCLTA
jgi:flagellar protein FliS